MPKMLQPWGILTAILFALSSPVLSASEASRGVKSSSKEGANSWKDPSREDCGFGCLYNKANENIGLQVKYIFNKLFALYDATNDQRAAALGAFCFQGEKIEDCLNRYFRVQVYVLRKMQAAMVKNYESSTLVSNEKGSSKELIHPSFVGIASKDSPKKDRQAPYVVTYEDLKREYEEIRKLGSNDYQKWAEHLPLKPSREDFAIFEEKLKDPTDPNRGHFLVVAHDEKGNVKYNKKAYEEALKKYNETLEAEFKRMEKLKPARKNMPRTLDGAIGDLNKSAFIESQKFKVQTWTPPGGQHKIQSQGDLNFTKLGPSPGPSKGSKLKEEVKEMSIEDLKKQEVESIYHSPQAIGDVIEKLEKIVF
jgi:hypothetical protein